MEGHGRSFWDILGPVQNKATKKQVGKKGEHPAHEVRESDIDECLEFLGHLSFPRSTYPTFPRFPLYL